MWLSKFQLMSMDNTKSYKIQKMGIVDLKCLGFIVACVTMTKKQLTTLNLCNTIFLIQQLQISRSKCMKEDVEVIKVYISKHDKKETSKFLK